MVIDSAAAHQPPSSTAPWRRLGNSMRHSKTATVSTPTRVWTL